MQINHHTIYSLFLFFSFLVLSGCGSGSSSNPSIKITKIEISNTPSQLFTQKTTQLNVTATLSDDTTKNITSDIQWETNRMDIATISPDGLLQTKNLIDDIIISASYQSFKTSVTLPITAAADATLFSLDLPADNNELSKDDEIIVSATYTDGSIDKNMLFSIEAVSYNSQGYAVLEVNNTIGSFAITQAATTEVIFIEESPAAELVLKLERIEISTTRMQIGISDSITLTVQGFYDDGSEKDLADLNWQSSDENIASVDTFGKLMSYQLSSDVQITVDYFDPLSENTFSDAVTITVYSADSFDFMRLNVGNKLSTLHIENSSKTSTPTIQAFKNPVGLLSTINLLAPYEGFYITLDNPASNEQLVLAIANPSLASLDKNEAMAIYRLNGESYVLDSRSTTLLNITVESLDTISKGSFSAILCKENANDCEQAANRLSLSGSFYITNDKENIYQGYPIDTPKLIDATLNMHHQQIGRTSSYYHLLTTENAQYKISATSPGGDVSFEAYPSLEAASIGSSTLTQNLTHSLTFTAETAETFLVFNYQGEAAGSTFQIKHDVLTVTTQGEGSSEAPIQFNRGDFFTGQVDSTESYYEIKVAPGYTYRIFVLKDTVDTGSQTISEISFKTNAAGTYLACSDDFICVVEADDSSSIFIKITGPDGLGNYAKYAISAVYNHIRDANDPDEAFTLKLSNIVDLKGQVPYGLPVTNGPSANSSLYWVTEVKPSTYYKVSLSGLQDGTRLWINGPSLDFIYNCPGGVVGSALSPDVYCIIKTQSFAYGFALNIDNSSTSGGRRGTTYTLNISEVPADELYHFSTFANESTFSNGAEVLGYSLYLNDSAVPFASSITKMTRFHKKLIHLRSGESVFIRVIDVNSQGNAYSIHLGDTYPISAISVPYGPVENPDIYELNNEGIKANATPLSFNMSSKHSLSYNNGDYGDIDWFIFTAP